MIPKLNQNIIDAAIKKLPSPLEDASYLNKALELAESGNMFANPAAAALDSFSQLGFDQMASAMSPTSFPTFAGFDAKAVTGDVTASCRNIQSLLEDMNVATTQMLTNVTPTKASLPPSIMAMSGANPQALEFGMPSISQMLSAAHNEQLINERLGKIPTRDDGTMDPCLPVSTSLEALMSTIRSVGSSLSDMVTGGFAKLNAFGQEILDATGNVVKVGVNAAKTAVLAATTAMKIAAANAIAAFGTPFYGSLMSTLEAKKAAFSSAAKDVTDMIKSVTAQITKAAQAIGNSINETFKSVERSLRVGIAQMVKDLSFKNPCMREVLAPTPATPTPPASSGTITPPPEDGQIVTPIIPIAVLPVQDKPLLSPAMRNAMGLSPPLSNIGKTIRATRVKQYAPTDANGLFTTVATATVTPTIGTNGSTGIFKSKYTPGINPSWEFSYYMSEEHLNRLIDDIVRQNMSEEDILYYEMAYMEMRGNDGGLIYRTPIYLYLQYNQVTEGVKLLTMVNDPPNRRHFVWDELTISR